MQIGGRFFLGACSTKSANLFTIDTALVNITFVEESGIRIYPNPANEKIFIEAPEGTNVEILNIYGKTIYNLSTMGTKTGFDISCFATGIYIIRVKTQKGISVTKLG